MRFKKLKFAKALLLLTIIVNTSVFAQKQQKPVKWDYSIKQINDSIYEMKATAKIAEDWYLYGRNFERGGPMPLDITFECSSKYQIIGVMTESKTAKEETDPFFEIMVKYFSGTVSFTQQVKILEKPLKLPIYVDGQACNKKNGTCMLIKEEHYFKIKRD